MTPEELELEADRLLEEWALSQPRTKNRNRGSRRTAGPALRRAGVLTRRQLRAVEETEVPLSAFGDGRDLVEEDE